MKWIIGYLLARQIRSLLRFVEYTILINTLTLFFFILFSHNIIASTMTKKYMVELHVLFSNYPPKHTPRHILKSSSPCRMIALLFALPH